MREVELASMSEHALFAACVAAILEVSPADLPVVVEGEPLPRLSVVRWLGGLGMGLVPVADASKFGWSGPWIGCVCTATGATGSVVMYGNPGGAVAWDPGSLTTADGWRLESGYVIAALDIALARPPRWKEPATAGTVDGIFIASGSAAPAISMLSVRAVAGRGLEGDRHLNGKGTFPSGTPGSALTLIEAEVCDSFTPPLEGSIHRRNIVTRGIELNGLVGRELLIGGVRCRGVRLAEPCIVLDRYAGRRLVRALAHRGGLRADILDDGTISVGDTIRLA